MMMLEDVANLLKKRGLKIAVAESCTGGLIAHTLTNVPGSSQYFDRGIISYSNRAKVESLGVQRETLERYGAVSRQTAEEMAVGVREKARVDMGIATTGIAGPGGGTKEKPVGLVYIALSTPKGTDVKEFKFHGDRWKNKERTRDEALDILLKYLKGKT